MSQHTLTQHPPMSIRSAISEGTTNLQFNTGPPVALLSPHLQAALATLSRELLMSFLQQQMSWGSPPFPCLHPFF